MRIGSSDGMHRGRLMFRIGLGRGNAKHESRATGRISGMLELQRHIDRTFARGLITLCLPDGL